MAKQAATTAIAGVAVIAMIGFVAVLAVKKPRGDAVVAMANEVDEHDALLGGTEGKHAFVISDAMLALVAVLVEL